MGSDEIAVIDYLKQFPKSFTTAAEVCKKAASRRRYARDPEWAKPALRRLEADGHLITDGYGHYKLTDALIAKYTEHSREATRLDRARKAVAAKIKEMKPGDDDRTFSALIREAMTEDYDDEVGLRKKK